MKQFSDIKNVTCFFKEEDGGKWIMKVKSLYDNIKIMFKLNSLQVQVAEGEDIYKFIITTQDYNKIPIGYIIYYPKERILEVYDDNLLFQFKGKQTLIKNINPILIRAGVDELFKRLTNII